MALHEVEAHRRDTGHDVARLSVWQVKAVMMEKKLEPLARLVAQSQNISYEEYMERVRDRLRRSPPGVLASTLIWQDAIRLKLVKPGQSVPGLEYEVTKD